MTSHETADHGSRTRRWLDRLSHSKRAMWVLFGASFAETLVVPIPIEVILIPFMAANRARLWTIAAVVTLGCLIASVVGYGVGLLVFETLGQQLIDAMGWNEGMDRFRTLFDDYGFWAIVVVGVLPIPFQVALLGAGAASYPMLWFLLAALLARGTRYFGLALLVHLFGERASDLWHRHKLSASLIAGGLALAIFAAVRALG
ncbi:alkaline phosphatase [Pseudoponticoccus marisrubri]|uniref:Alkaline phosphatase n=2 Tax=Pseudoponticoccus marisrubri TaxID=1685382 RepID=A0A0W7WHY1_9RHOB|nr:alkaline phosphatase [Pseudoponticoccus marisrubri]